MYKRFSIIMLAVALSSCGTPQQKASALEENKEAKSLLEGIWLDDNTETALLRVKGDTLFYADAGRTFPSRLTRALRTWNRCIPLVV